MWIDREMSKGKNKGSRYFANKPQTNIAAHEGLRSTYERQSLGRENVLSDNYVDAQGSQVPVEKTEDEVIKAFILKHAWTILGTLGTVIGAVWGISSYTNRIENQIDKNKGELVNYKKALDSQGNDIRTLQNKELISSRDLTSLKKVDDDLLLRAKILEEDVINLKTEAKLKNK